jgi:hypothetical protein
MGIFIEPAQFAKSRSYKMVRFASGTIRFCDACDHHVSHALLVQIQQAVIPGDQPISAGQIKVRDGKWHMESFDYSFSIEAKFGIKIGCLDDDEQVLQRLFDDKSVPLLYDEDLLY